MEKRITPIAALWALLSVACIVAILCGGWWHIGSLALCGLMFNATNEEE